MPRPLSLPDSYDPSAAKAARRNPPLYLPLRALTQRDQRGNQHAVEHAVENTLNLHFVKALDELKRATKYTYDELRRINGGWFYDRGVRLTIIVTPLTNELIYHYKTPQERRVPYDTIDFRGEITVPYYERLSRTAIDYLHATLSHVVLMAARVYGAQGHLTDLNDVEKTDLHGFMSSFVRLMYEESTNSNLPLRVLHELYLPKGPQQTLSLPPIVDFARSLPKLGTQRASFYSYNPSLASTEAAVHNPKRQGWGVVYSFEWLWCCPDLSTDSSPDSSSGATNQPPSLKRTHSNALSS